jgi:hypothetical protein
MPHLEQLFGPNNSPVVAENAGELLLTNRRFADKNIRAFFLAVLSTVSYYLRHM